MKDPSCVVLFVKFPEPGMVKSRLAASLGQKFVLSLYREFVSDTLDMLRSCGCPVIIAYDPPAYLGRFVTWLGDGHRYLAQIGGNVGERMEQAFQQSFALGFSRVVLMGSDVPDVPCAMIGEAFEALASHNTVIGPSRDGGYYLIGFTRPAFFPDVFRKMKWSTESVFQETRQRLARGRRSLHMLPMWRDVDTREDLRNLFERNRCTPFAQSKTMAYLGNHRETIDE
jgi:rSAM/selenodomain-associated transferase 1